MDRLSIPAGELSPSAELDPGAGTVIIKGESSPENAKTVYAPIIEWLNSYKNTSPGKLSLTFGFTYLNSLSLKYVYDLIKKAETIQEGGCVVNVSWEFKAGDEEMRENGEEFKRLVEMEFKLIEIQQ